MPHKHPTIQVKLTHKLNALLVEAPSTATFGDLKARLPPYNAPFKG